VSESVGEACGLRSRCCPGVLANGVSQGSGELALLVDRKGETRSRERSERDVGRACSPGSRECCAGPIRVSEANEDIPHSTRERVEGFQPPARGGVSSTASERVGGFRRVLMTAVVPADDVHLADSGLETPGQSNRRHPAKALGALRSRASLRSSFAPLTAVSAHGREAPVRACRGGFAASRLAAAGFPERTSPFQSTRRASSPEPWLTPFARTPGQHGTAQHRDRKPHTSPTDCVTRSLRSLRYSSLARTVSR